MPAVKPILLSLLSIVLGLGLGSPMVKAHPVTSDASSELRFTVRGEDGALLHESLVEIPADVPETNAGTLTVTELTLSGLAWSGSETAIESIAGLSQRVEFVDGALRVWGWCFSLDGIIPMTTPDQTVLNTQYRNLMWFWGWASQRNGQWTDMCQGQP